MLHLHFAPTQRIYIDPEELLIPWLRLYTSVKTGPPRDRRVRENQGRENEECAHALVSRFCLSLKVTRCKKPLSMYYDST